MDDLAPVACGACHHCCRNEMVVLQDNENPADYDCTTHATPTDTIHVLRHQPNGDCVYLGANGCSIHGRHPMMCRVFDCARFAALWPRQRRRAAGMGMTDVLTEGLRRLRETRHA
jgi:Fe-S-cluster containining protein